MIKPCRDWLFKNGSWISSIRCGADQIAYLTACGILSLLITCGNLVVIIVYLKTKNKKLRNTQTIYRTSIAFSDSITGAFILPTIIIGWTSKREIDPIRQHQFLLFATTLSSIVSIATLLLSACDRIFVVAFPMKYHFRNVLVRKIAIIASVIIWGCGILFSFLPFFAEGTGYIFTLSETLVVFSFYGDGGYLGNAILLIFAICFLIIGGIAIFLLLKYSRNARNLSSSASGRWRLEKKVSVTHCIMILAFIVSVSPAIGILLAGKARGVFIDPLKTYLAVEASVAFLYYTNSFWNCLVYSFRSKEFRDEARKIFHPLFKTLKCPRLGNRNVGPQNVVERAGRILPEAAV